MLEKINWWSFAVLTSLVFYFYWALEVSVEVTTGICLGLGDQVSIRSDFDQKTVSRRRMPPKAKQCLRKKCLLELWIVWKRRQLGSLDELQQGQRKQLRKNKNMNRITFEGELCLQKRSEPWTREQRNINFDEGGRGGGRIVRVQSSSTSNSGSEAAKEVWMNFILLFLFKRLIWSSNYLCIPLRTSYLI